MSQRININHARALALGLLATGSVVSAGPCDIYASGGTPCVAAHSTTRALYDAYSGPLYQVKRGSDSKTADIAPLTAGGVANASTQDTFCAKTTCLISIIYDQSGKKNHLTQAPPGGFSGPASGGYDNLASATGAPVTLNGHKAYGVFIAPGGGYRNNAATGTAKNDAAEGIYAVLDGTHYNGACCFDYGNAEVSSRDTGAGHMECIYFGNCNVWGSGSGNGPWIMADLENGLFSGQGAKKNTNDPTISHRFTTAVVKGQAGSWAIRGADATTGSLSTFYNGVRPSGYNPMKKEGAIILGIGGDNSHGAQGTFYEGAMTSGYPSDDTENAVQANIAAAKYAVGSATTKALALDKSLSFKTGSASTQYLAADSSAVNTRSTLISRSATLAQQQASWTVRTGLGNEGCVSFESAENPGSYLRHTDDFQLVVQPSDNTKEFAEDATFCTQDAFSGEGVSIRSWNHPDRYLRRYNNAVYAASNGGVDAFDDAASFHEDASWEVSTGSV